MSLFYYLVFLIIDSSKCNDYFLLIFRFSASCSVDRLNKEMTRIIVHLLFTYTVLYEL